jgi:hypothetical protein
LQQAERRFQQSASGRDSVCRKQIHVNACTAQILSPHIANDLPHLTKPPSLTIKIGGELHQE